MSTHKNKKKMGYTWIIYAFLAMLGVATVHLGYKLVGNKVNPNVFLLYLIIVEGIFYAVVVYKNNLPIKINLALIALVVFIGIIAAATNVFQVLGINLAPNPGFVSAIGASAVIIVAIASIFLFGSHLTLTKAIGIVLAVIGVAIISLAK